MEKFLILKFVVTDKKNMINKLDQSSLLINCLLPKQDIKPMTIPIILLYLKCFFVIKFDKTPTMREYNKFKILTAFDC